MFRMVRALEEAGHECVIHLYNLRSADLATYTLNIRTGWPAVRAEVRSANQPYPNLDACIATSWESAHVVATHFQQPMRRLYFVQDFEPYFHARGSEYALAADTYRFGFRIIALGHMVADCISKEVGIQTEIVDFGCDTSIYHLQDKTADRNGVVFYARSQTPRRGYWLGMLALQEFSKRHPDIPIFIYGSKLNAPLPDATVFPRLTPAELSSLYNRCTAGLAMSFTNISLIAEELLAAGCIPIVNDSPLSRADLKNPFVAWAPPTPGGIADTLSEVVTSTRIEDHAVSAAASVRRGWARTEEAVVQIVEDEVYGSG
jgi:glycosyltransferase involved in cell wall biosynthesis